MYKVIKVKIHLIKELWRSGDFSTALRHKIYSRAEAVPVRKDLLELPPASLSDEDMALSLIEIANESWQGLDTHFATKSRESRVDLYVKKGYRGFGLVKDGKIIGDIWYLNNELLRQNVFNPTIQEFHITLAEDDVYLFDMFIAANERGKVSTTKFLTRVLSELKGRGYRNALGFFFMSNLPALWVHRVIGYEELPHYSVRKYLMWKIIRPVAKSNNLGAK